MGNAYRCDIRSVQQYGDAARRRLRREAQAISAKGATSISDASGVRTNRRGASAPRFRVAQMVGGCKPLCHPHRCRDRSERKQLRRQYRVALRRPARARGRHRGPSLRWRRPPCSQRLRRHALRHRGQGAQPRSSRRPRPFERLTGARPDRPRYPPALGRATIRDRSPHRGGSAPSATRNDVWGRTIIDAQGGSLSLRCGTSSGSDTGETERHRGAPTQGDLRVSVLGRSHHRQRVPETRHCARACARI